MNIELSEDKKITNFDALARYIDSCIDTTSLIALSSELQDLVLNNKILASDANDLLNIIKRQIDILKNNTSINNEKGKRYTITPSGRPTYLQSREGIVALGLLVLNICIIVIMYSFLIIAKFIK